MKTRHPELLLWRVLAVYAAFMWLAAALAGLSWLTGNRTGATGLVGAGIVALGCTWGAIATRRIERSEDDSR